MDRVFPIIQAVPIQHSVKPRTLILVDADNISFAQAEAFLSALHETTHVVDFLGFGDVGNGAKDWLKAEHSFPKARVQGVFAGASLKNGADIALSIAAVESVLADAPDMVVLVSSDSDFTPLVKFIQERGVQVIGVGNNNLHPARKNLFDGFHPIATAKTKSKAKTTKKKAKTTKKKVTVPITKSRMDNGMLERLKSVIQSVRDKEGSTSLSILTNEMRKLDPEFGWRHLGHARLSTMLKFHGDDFELTKNKQRVRLRGGET